MIVATVYKSLIRLAFLVVLVSSQDSAFAANTAQSPAQNGSSVLSTAEASFKKGDFNAVTDLLWKNIDKLDRKGLLLLAITHEKKNEPGNMIKVANMLISKDPKDYEALYLLGSAQMMNKKNSEALESLKSALEINPKYEPAYDKLVQMYEQKKNYYELRILYQDMMDHLGHKPETLTKLCELNTNKDFQEDQALSNCKEAIAKDPKTADNYVYLGLVHQHVGDTEEAKKDLKNAADTHSKSELAQYTYANLLEEQKNYLDSSKYYQTCTVADPKSSRCWSGYAKSAFEIHKYDEALEAYKKACKLDQKTAVAFRRATTVLRNAKDSTWLKPYETASESCSGY